MENEPQRNEEDQNLYDLLESWNLLSLFDKLKAQHCFVPVLKIIKPHQIEKIVTDVPVGIAILFEHCLESWRLEINSPLNCSTPESVSFSSEFSKSTKENKQDLQLILMMSNNGKSLIQYYNKHHYFKEAQRKLFINTIAKYIADSGLPFSLGESYNLEQEILKLFPNEKLEYYRTCKRGRIYAKVCNLKTQMKIALSELTAPTLSSSTEDNQYVPEEDFETIRNSLTDEKLNEDEFIYYWKKCSQYRFSQIEKCKTAADIFKIWPEYTNANGIRMFDIDFSNKYSSSANIHESWALNSNKIETFLKQKISQKSKNGINLNSLNEDTRENTRDIILLMNLHQFLLSPNKGGGKQPRKYSVEDSLGAFAIFGKSYEEVEDKLRHISTKKQFLQPLIILIGDIHMIKDIFVYVDGFRFKTMYVIHALDICFKIFFVLNLKYPEEANLFWVFIEQFFYKLKCSKPNIKVSTLCNELNS